MRRKTNEQSAEIAEAGAKLRAALVEEGLQRLFYLSPQCITRECCCRVNRASNEPSWRAR